MSSCTRKRCGATHTCPALRCFQATALRAISPRSATSGSTMAGALPPSSSASCVIVAEAPSIRILPTRGLPVNAILRTRGSVRNTSPIASGSPLTRFITPLGMPASSSAVWIARASSIPERGVYSAGRPTTVQPAASAAAQVRTLL